MPAAAAPNEPIFAAQVLTAEAIRPARVVPGGAIRAGEEWTVGEDQLPGPPGGGKARRLEMAPGQGPGVVSSSWSAVGVALHWPVDTPPWSLSG
jgi:hypothetical protein